MWKALIQHVFDLHLTLGVLHEAEALSKDSLATSCLVAS